ncbi:raffinose/stachyose/melibiose transport system substrate-binding protein [Salsuginibacillus halophilus]|uniref:Raffinose/stachyose/melibiose transport system substrate-binding protein n=1 Tax=Salsuginibacillus halophilus TaxID=517424 RepID=A0A2P8HAL0_9BACI|nr:ABC transporter substrate-binding protein [Salsuginibacillus halophilus]PSL43257.1 raffinose/stachyose/melibiose transport system substrate-binding protein [Salsuginibacillus halophilus]
MGSMKKFNGWLLLGSAGMILTACNGDDEAAEGTDDGEDTNGDVVDVEIFQGKVEFRDQFIELSELYEEENPNVNIEFSAVGGGTDYFSTLRSRFSSGDEPDVFSLAGPSELNDYEDNVLDLSDHPAVDEAIDGTLEGATDGDGNIRGIPFQQEGYGLLYNKRMFDEAGIDADEILTYEDLEEAVETLDDQKDELGIDGVFALPGAEAWVMGDHLANTYLSPEFNGDMMEAYESDTVDFERADEMERMLMLQNDYSIEPVLNMDYSQQVEEYFSLERTAMIQQGDWVHPTLEQMDPEFANEHVGVLPLPVEDYEGHIPVDVPNYWAINEGAEDDVIEEAEAFFEWMYTDEEGIAAVQDKLDMIPAHEGFDVDEIDAPIQQEIYEYVLEENTLGWIFTGYPQGWGTDFGAHVQEYLSGGRDWDDVIEAGQEEWEQSRE